MVGRSALGHQYWRFEKSIAWQPTFYLNLIWRVVSYNGKNLENVDLISPWIWQITYLPLIFSFPQIDKGKKVVKAPISFVFQNWTLSHISNVMDLFTNFWGLWVFLNRVKFSGLLFQQSFLSFLLEIITIFFKKAHCLYIH